MVREEAAAVGLHRTEAAEGWRRRDWPLINSDFSRTGDDLRSDAEAITYLFKILSHSHSLLPHIAHYA